MFKKLMVVITLLSVGTFAKADGVNEDVMKSLLEKSATLSVVVNQKNISLAQYVASKMSWPINDERISSSFSNECESQSNGDLQCSFYVSSTRNQKSPFEGGVSRFIFEQHILQYAAHFDGVDYQILTNPLNLTVLE